MANTILITANWHTGALSQQTISRQYDNNRYVVQFVGYPEASEGNELDYYLLVWMSSAPGETPDEIAPIQLASDQWYISNVFTQQTQQIKFQMCALNTEGTFEAHSPIFTGFVRNSLEHDGTTQDIDVSTLFDAYREYLNELIIRSGAVVIDPTLSQSGQAADAGAVGDALADDDARLEGLESVVGQTKTLTPTWTDGRSINPNTGGTNASEISSNTQGISCEGFDRLRITMPLYATSINTRGLAFYSVFPSTDPIGTANFISGIRANYDTALSADSSEVREVSIPPGAKYFRTTWYASSEEQFSTEFVCELIKDGTLDVTIDNINSELDVVSDNVFNKTALVLGKFIGLNGNIGTSASYAYTDYIAVKTGDVVKGYSAESYELTFRYVCAYNKDKVPISASGAENTKSYTVPDGIAYVRVTGSVRSDSAGINSATARITLNGIDSKYQTYKNGPVSDFAQSLYTATQLLTGYPLTTLNSYILKSLAYKPLGVLSKGYVCLVSDDGDAELATYTIPMLESKGDVPCTFAVMHQSAVFQSQSGIDAVVNAVTNHNCNIAQHGVQLWNTFDEYTFNAFLDSELAYFQSLGLTPYGAVCPQHAITDIVKAVAGGRLGCVRTGYNNADMYYGTYQNGPRSNMYALSSQSSLDGSLADQIVALNACKANKWLRIIHWHENELTSEKKAVLEGIIDYVLADNELTFVTMKDIPSII